MSVLDELKLAFGIDVLDGIAQNPSPSLEPSESTSRKKSRLATLEYIPQATAAASTTSSTFRAEEEEEEPSAEARELKALVRTLKDELEDAHARIDQLTYLLKDKVAFPLIRGLDRLGRKE